MKKLLLLIMIITVGRSMTAQIVNVPADYSSIQAAIESTENGDTIIIAEGTYLENLRFNGKAVTLSSLYITDNDESHISKTIIDGSQPSDPDTASVVLFNQGVDSTSVLIGLTITGGNGTYYPHPWGTHRAGGGVFIEEGSGGKITHCIIRDNNMSFDYPVWGGGICAMLGKVGDPDLERSILIQHNIIRGNTISTSDPESPSGGGIKIGTGDEYKYGRIIIEHNLIDSNVVKNTNPQGNAVGGGLNFGMCLPTPPGEYHIRNNIFAHNKLEAPDFVRGAGMMLIHLVVRPTYFEDLDPQPLVYNNLIYENESSQFAGGIAARITLMVNNSNFYTVAQPVIMHNTIVDNKARYGVGYYSNNSVALLMNNIFDNDLSRAGATEIVQAGISVASLLYNNLVSDGYIPEKCPNSDNISGNALLTSQYHLTDNSPCIGKGIDSVYVRKTWHYLPGFDYDGNPRPNPVDQFIDIGACESSFPHPDIWPPETTCPDTINESGTFEVTSSESAVIYLVPQNTEKNVNAISDCCIDSAIVTENSSVTLSIIDSPYGVYWIYAMDNSGNISDARIIYYPDQVPPEILYPEEPVVNLYQPDEIEISSSENGMVYLVPVGTEQILDSIVNCCYASSAVTGDTISFTLNDTAMFTNGEYWVFAVDEAGNISDPKVIMISGVYVRNEYFAKVRIYPNPTKGFLTIERFDAGPLQVEIYAVNGQLLYKETSTKTRYQIDMLSFSKGMYMMILKTKDGVIIEKLMKQ